MRRLLIAAALPLMLAACDGGGDPVNQALREASSAVVPEAAAIRRCISASPSA